MLKKTLAREMINYLNLPIGIQRRVRIKGKAFRLRAGEIRPPKKGILGTLGVELRRKF